jgi:hypothetical protein
MVNNHTPEDPLRLVKYKQMGSFVFDIKIKDMTPFRAFLMMFFPLTVFFTIPKLNLKKQLLIKF